MNEMLLKEKVSKIASFNGIEIFHIKTDKFKTNTIDVFFSDNLNRENVTKNALVPAVMRRGTRNHKTFKDLALYLENLYGGSFDCGISKKGERQLIHFHIEHISGKYTESNEDLFEKSFELLFEIITEPYTENGVFSETYVEQEKENLKNRIEGKINDKIHYAVERCYEEMCNNEPFGLYEYGNVEDLPKIDNHDLYKQYEYITTSLPMHAFITGDVNQNSIDKEVEKLKSLTRKKIKAIKNPLIKKMIKEPREVTQKMNVNQSKLSLGFRTNTKPNEDDYYSLAVYNGILGGGLHSKLFQNVREKSGLAYYIFSRLEKYKGLMIISSGIEGANKEKAVNIICEQIEEIKKGNITDYEYQSTMKAFKTGIQSLKDNHIKMVDFYLSQAIIDSNDTFESVIKKIESVSLEDVVKISERIQLEIIYFLIPKV